MSSDERIRVCCEACGWHGYRRRAIYNLRLCPGCDGEVITDEQHLANMARTRAANQAIEAAAAEVDRIRRLTLLAAPDPVALPVSKADLPVPAGYVYQMRTTLEGKMLTFAIPPHCRRRPNQRRRRR